MKTALDTPLNTLISSIDAALAEPANNLGRAVTTALETAVTSRNWLDPLQQLAHGDHYTRYVLHADPLDRYTVVAIAWGSGQSSPIHAHHTWCSVAVYHGEINETFFSTDEANGTPRALRSIRRRPGTLSFDEGGAGIHQIANIAEETAVSIHVYGIAAAQIATGVNHVMG